MTIKISG